MATHSSILAWEIPWTEEPEGLQSMGPQRVRHDRAGRAVLCCAKSLQLCLTVTLWTSAHEAPLSMGFFR